MKTNPENARPFPLPDSRGFAKTQHIYAVLEADQQTAAAF